MAVLITLALVFGAFFLEALHQRRKVERDELTGLSSDQLSDDAITWTPIREES